MSVLPSENGPQVLRPVNDPILEVLICVVTGHQMMTTPNVHIPGPSGMMEEEGGTVHGVECRLGEDAKLEYLTSPVFP